MSKMKKSLLTLLLAITFVFIPGSLTPDVFAQAGHGTFNYTVREGNTLYLLAERFNSTVEEISSLNPQVEPGNLRIGSRIKITPGAGIMIHPVKKGETLWRIARKHNSSIRAIAEKNRIEDPDLIFAGDILAVPEQGMQDDAAMLSKHIAGLFKKRDFPGVVKYVHPTKGVRFSPYAYVDVKSDLVFSSAKVAKFSSDTKKYTWGAYDGTGDPIILTPVQYFERFVYRKDFATEGQISLNKMIGTGNALENQFEVYPGSSIVEFYIPGTEKYGHMDWQSLRLVFEKYKGKWVLVGVVHNEWTI